MAAAYLSVSLDDNSPTLDSPVDALSSVHSSSLPTTPEEFAPHTPPSERWSADNPNESLSFCDLDYELLEALSTVHVDASIALRRLSERHRHDQAAAYRILTLRGQLARLTLQLQREQERHSRAALPSCTCCAQEMERLHELEQILAAQRRPLQHQHHQEQHSDDAPLTLSDGYATLRAWFTHRLPPRCGEMLGRLLDQACSAASAVSTVVAKPTADRSAATAVDEWLAEMCSALDQRCARVSARAAAAAEAYSTKVQFQIARSQNPAAAV